MKPLEELVQQHLRGLHPYTPGDQPDSGGWIKLNTNELPFSPPDCVMEAIGREVSRLNRYPNPISRELREAIARHHGLAPGQVIIGNGSDDILNLLVRAFGGDNRQTAESFPSYSLYPVLTSIAGGQIQSVPLNEDFSLPVDALLEARADLLFITCPNAPSGVRFPLEELRLLAQNTPGILVVDEAYAEFSDGSALPLLEENGNTVVTRTFSKAYGLAGLRVGYGLASPAVIEVLDCIRDSYNVNRLSQAGAIAALEAAPVYAAFIRQIRETRELVRDTFLEWGWFVYPSETNFLFVAPMLDGAEGKSADMARSLFQWLLDHKILVRHFAKHPLTAPFLRISIGTQSEMERFLQEAGRWKRNAKPI